MRMTTQSRDKTAIHDYYEGYANRVLSRPKHVPVKNHKCCVLWQFCIDWNTQQGLIKNDVGRGERGDCVNTKTTLICWHARHIRLKKIHLAPSWDPNNLQQREQSFRKFHDRAN